MGGQEYALISKGQFWTVGLFVLLCGVVGGFLIGRGTF